MADDPFSSSYRQAREKFQAAAAQAGAQLHEELHPLRGRDGEALAIDVALSGGRDAERLLIASSACHGVEGFCGSGVQVAALRDEAWRAAHADAGVAVLHVHAINPYGFSHLRRVTHENIDLNRNFQDFSRPRAANPAYREVHAWLVPQAWPPGADNEAALQRYLGERGPSALQAAVTGGQYEFADGLFYGGDAPAWSNLAFRRILRSHAARARQIGWIDLHTGLGPSGHGERGFAGDVGDAAGLARATAWWGGAGATPISRFDDGSSVSAPVAGVIWTALRDECPQAESTAIAIEFGTQPLMQVLQALRAEQWLENHPGAPAPQALQIKAQLRDAFYVETPEWKRAILAQARDALLQGVAGLANG